MCSCNKGAAWTSFRPDGSKATYRTELEAAADARRTGGTYKQGS